jgi:hypothetical protein
MSFQFADLPELQDLEVLTNLLASDLSSRLLKKALAADR